MPWHGPMEHLGLLPYQSLEVTWRWRRVFGVAWSLSGLHINVLSGAFCQTWTLCLHAASHNIRQRQQPVTLTDPLMRQSVAALLPNIQSGKWLSGTPDTCSFENFEVSLAQCVCFTPVGNFICYAEAEQPHSSAVMTAQPFAADGNPHPRPACTVAKESKPWPIWPHRPRSNHASRNWQASSNNRRVATFRAMATQPAHPLSRRLHQLDSHRKSCRKWSGLQPRPAPAVPLRDGHWDVVALTLFKKLRTSLHAT